MKYLIVTLVFILIATGLFRDEKKILVTIHCTECGFAQKFESDHYEMLKLRCPYCHENQYLLYEDNL